MRWLGAIAASALVLTACNLLPQPTDTPAIKAAGDKMRAIRETCRERRLAGEFTTLVQSERCANPAVVQAYEDAHYPYMDIIRFGGAARIAGAEKVDKGEITEAEYDRQRFILRDRVADEIDRRNAATWGSRPAPDEAPEIDSATKAKLIAGLSAFSALMP